MRVVIGIVGKAFRLQHRCRKCRRSMGNLASYPLRPRLEIRQMSCMQCRVTVAKNAFPDDGGRHRLSYDVRGETALGGVSTMRYCEMLDAGQGFGCCPIAQKKALPAL